MRRTLTLVLAFLALLGTVLVLPVYAEPGPAVEPVETSVDEVPLGSVEEPAAEAEVQEGTTEPVAGVAETAPALSVVRTETDPFSLVGVTWAYDPAVVDVVVQVRVQDGAGAWGAWTEVTVEDSEQGADADAGTAGPRGGTAPLWTGPSTGVEAELVTRAGAQPTDVRLDLVDPGTSAADSQLTTPEIQDTADAALAMPDVYSRAQWGADEGIRTWDPEYAPTIKAAVLHHTADTNNYTAEQVPAMLRSIYRYHSVSRGWGDIGYNVLVDKFGRRWEGRAGGLASAVVGAHAGGFNSGTFGVSMLGNYDTTDTPQVMVDSVAAIIAWKFSLYGVNPQGTTRLTSGGGTTNRYAAGTTVTLPTIFGHRDTGTTTCPGQYGYARLDSIRQKANGLIAGAFNPVGSFDSVSVEGQWVTVRGWATDPDTSGPVTMHVYADGANVVATPVANQTRDGVSGPHAYTATFPLVFGQHTVCVYAMNHGPGTTNPHLGCKTVVIDPSTFNPRGALDPLVADGRSVTVSGWASDPDAPRGIQVHVYVDGAPRTALSANRTTTSNGSTGYSGTLQLSDGAHSVCVYAINVGRGTTNPHLGCRSVTVSMAPVGALESVTAVGRTVSVAGWASDPDAPSQAVQVHLYANGQGVAILAANRPARGGHGFEGRVTLPLGTQNVCAWAINVGAGSSNTLLGCRSVRVSMDPVGALTRVTTQGARAQVVGWASDPDVPNDAVAVHVYLDGRPVLATRASATLDGVAGPHGYDVTVPVGSPGAHTLCTYAMNVGQGTNNTHLGCRSFTVPVTAFDPSGALQPLQVAGPVATVSGAVGDPDAAAPVQVHVYVDGVGAAVLLADGASADGRRAFQGRITLAPGSHSLCLYAINQGQGTGNRQLGCQQTDIPVAAYNPVGELTSVTAAAGRITVAGWAADPDSNAAVAVHVYVDGAGVAILSANRTAAGVTGPRAYLGEVALPAGPHRVCTYAINIGRGTTNPHLGCRDVQV